MVTPLAPLLQKAHPMPSQGADMPGMSSTTGRTLDGIEETVKFPLPKGLRMDAATGLELRERIPETGSGAGH